MKRITTILFATLAGHSPALAGARVLATTRPVLPRLETGSPRSFGALTRSVICDPWTLAALHRRHFTGGAR